MSKTRLAFVAAACIAACPTVRAQDAPADAGMPNPRHEQHDALRQLAGNWQLAIHCEPMPGVPGMEEATDSTGTERAELICDGLWVKSTMRGTQAGEPFEGLWLVGYDPNAKRYTGVWASSHEEDGGFFKMDGHYDPATR